MMANRKRYSVIFTILVLVVLFAASCKNKCHDCIRINEETQVKDTINTICEDDPAFNANYFSNWKLVCLDAGGQTITREDE